LRGPSMRAMAWQVLGIAWAWAGAAIERAAANVAAQVAAIMKALRMPFLP
jgi:hypothetical protein